MSKKPRQHNTNKISIPTRFGALAMLVNMSVAIIVTKLPILFVESFGPSVLRELKTYGFWSMTHEMRTDFAMWLGCLFLLIKGGGRWSMDRVIGIRFPLARE